MFFFFFFFSVSSLHSQPSYLLTFVVCMRTVCVVWNANTKRNIPNSMVYTCQNICASAFHFMHALSHIYVHNANMYGGCFYQRALLNVNHVYPGMVRSHCIFIRWRRGIGSEWKFPLVCLCIVVVAYLNRNMDISTAICGHNVSL